MIENSRIRNNLADGVNLRKELVILLCVTRISVIMGDDSASGRSQVVFILSKRHENELRLAVPSCHGMMTHPPPD